MNIKEAYRWAITSLAEFSNPQLEARVLIGYALRMSPSDVPIHLFDEIKAEQFTKIQGLVNRRLKHEPAAYIIGHKEFMGYEMIVNSNVLIPRPETESLVNKAFEIAKNHDIHTIYDIGTGCGAIAIGLAKNLPDAKIIASDISKKALNVAKQNIEKHEVADRVTLVESDLDEHVERGDLVVANLPYLPDNFEGDADLKFEPKVALFAQDYGLSFYYKFFEKPKFRFYVVEMSELQAPILADWLKERDFKCNYIYDLAGTIAGLEVENVKA